MNRGPIATVHRKITQWLTKLLCSNFIRFPKDNNSSASDEIEFALEIRKDLVAASGYPELTTFVNYAHGDEKIERIYGAHKLPQLAALKKKWDPNQQFSFNNGIPIAY